MTENKFIAELKKINININEFQLQQLKKYYDLLIIYNKKINLTSLIDKDIVYLKHFYDSLTLSKAINLKTAETLCDVGSGAGFPGLVIKILFPHLKITLIDSTNKKILFLKHVIKELNLNNIEAIHTRVEDYIPNNREKYDIVTARAVAKLNVLIELCSSLVKIGGFFISLKGNISLEIKNIESAKEFGLKIKEIIEFNLPIENSNRTIISFVKIKKTPLKYPRHYNEIIKNPFLKF